MRLSCVLSSPLLALCLLAPVEGCAPVPRPGILAEVDETRATAASKEASARAPQAYLAAEKLRRTADEALENGDRAGAEILGERALAAYGRAQILARLARAEERRAQADARLTRARHDLADLDALQQKVGAEVTDLETRVRAERDAVPIVPSEAGSAEREKARLAAARAIAEGARLLCVAASLLAPEDRSLPEAFTALDALDTELGKVPARVPIDSAVRLRTRCLTALTSLRHPTSSRAPEDGKVDALLDELGRAGKEPVRDDRGVVVVLRNVFEGPALSKGAPAELAALAQVARSHPDFPILAVVHRARGAATDLDRKRAELVAKALRDAGAARAEGRAAGSVLPVAAPGSPGTAARNERVELVYVAPTD